MTLQVASPALAPAITPAPTLSVILAVQSSEDVVGRTVRSLAERLRALGTSFEVLAVNDGCFDTSFAVLALLARDVPELRLLPRDVSGRAFARGVTEARAAAVLLLETSRGTPPLASFGWILGRLAAGREAVVLRGRCVAARKLPAIAALTGARGRGDLYERAFERAAVRLDVEIVGTARRRGLASSLAGGLLRPVRRLLAA